MGDEVATKKNEGTETIQRKGREGARWINQRPTSSEFAEWAKENIKVPEGLQIEDYLGGIVLIPAVDKKSKFVDGFTPQGEPKIGERPEMVYVPYAKVETRLQFFWDLLELHEDWVGVIEPILTPRPELDMVSEVITTEAVAREDEYQPATVREIRKPTATAAIVHQLPPGFFLMPVPLSGGYSYFLCCSYRVAVYEKPYTKDSLPIRQGRGTKQVALVVQKWRDAPLTIDENAVMKAETGAIGRALGAAGIFTIPGSGIATAEDMLEASAGDAVATGAEAQDGAGPAAPGEPPAPASAQQEKAADEPSDENVLKLATGVVSSLQADFPAAYEAFGEWCSKRKPKITDLGTLKGPELRGVYRKLSRLLEEALGRQESRGQRPAAVAPETAAAAGGPVVAPESAGDTLGAAVPPEGGESPALV